MATSLSGGRSRSTRGEPSTMGKQLVNFITCAVSRIHPLCNLQSRVRTHAVLMIGLYELLGNPITFVPNSLSHQGPYTSNEDNISSVVFPFVIVFFGGGGDICVLILLIYCTTNDSQCKYILNILR